ncbi:hypothetical protein ACFLXQ_07930 [Chloroflexota bacterium]
MSEQFWCEWGSRIRNTQAEPRRSDVGEDYLEKPDFLPQWFPPKIPWLNMSQGIFIEGARG